MSEQTIVIDTLKDGTVPYIEAVETIVNTITGERQERHLRSFSVSSVQVTKTEHYLSVEMPGAWEETDAVYSFALEFGEQDIGNSAKSRKELKIIPDSAYPQVAFHICGYLSMSLGRYDGDTPILTFMVSEDRAYGYVVNDGVVLSLAHGKEAFKDISRISPDEHAFIETILQQQAADWVIPHTHQKPAAVGSAILDDIKAVFDALADHERNIINMNELHVIAGAEDTTELHSMIGMDTIKYEIEVLEAKLKYRQDMQKAGFVTDDVSGMHMCFLGAPGTGKTTVARIITGVLSKYGYVKQNKCIEINARQLIGSFVGQTPFRTATIINAARGGVLFIDEAYTLMSNSSHDHTAEEAIAQLLKAMEDNRGNLIVILAGYDADMQRFLDINEGMRSRINKYIHFENYTVFETMEIFLLRLRKEGLYINREALERVLLLMKKCCMAPGFSNGRFVRNLYEKIFEQHGLTVYKQGLIGHDADLITGDTITDAVCRQMLEAQR